MAGVKISALPAIVTPATTDVFPVVQAGVTYKETISQLGTLLLPISGGTLTGNLTLFGDPSTNLMAATKQYVDAVATGLNIQAACRVASTVALTVTYSNGASGVGATLTNAGAQAAIAIDGVTLALNDRVLIKNQASSLQNGIYTVSVLGSGATNWVLTRATDFDTPAEIQPGDLVSIVAGTTQASSSWMQTATVTTVGTDPITFIQFSASLPITVPNGGTGRTTSTTAYGLIAAGTTATGALQTLPTGSAGQVLQSAGAAALPAYSTPTYPSASGTAGQILRSNATNNIYSTSAFADTYAASTVLYSNGANNVVGLATAASGFLVTDVSGVPSISSTVPAHTTSSITFNPTTGGIVGTTTNDDTVTGKVGEFASSIITYASRVSLSSTVAANLTSLSLTAGDWDVYGNTGFNFSTTGFSNYAGWISLTSATVPEPAIYNSIPVLSSAVSTLSFSVATLRVSIAVTTTVYLSVSCFLTSGTAEGFGAIYARRRR